MDANSPQRQNAMTVVDGFDLAAQDMTASPIKGLNFKLFGGRFGEAICAANAFEQSVSRVFQQIRRIIEASPLLRANAKVLQDKITVAGAVITAIPSDYASAAGANPVISVFDELWAFDSERSRRLFDELIPPPTRKIACRLTVTYAGFSGESVLLEELYKRGMAQPEVGPSLYAGDGLLIYRVASRADSVVADGRLAQRHAALAQSKPVSAHDRKQVGDIGKLVCPLGGLGRLHRSYCFAGPAQPRAGGVGWY